MRLTIVSPSSYPALVPGKIEFAGGAEFQLLMLARAMRDRGHAVSFVVGDYGQPSYEEAQGFPMYRCFELFKGQRKLRFLPDMLKLRAALRASRPEVVNQRSTAFYTGQTCWFSHQAGAAFVFSLGIDYNCWPDLQGRVPWPIPALYGWGIRNAEMVLAQTAEQAELMVRNFGRADTRVLPNLLEVHEPRSMDEDKGYVLWVGSLARRKQPELLLEVATLCPDIRFRLIGGPGEDIGYDQEMRTRAATIPNLEWIGFVPPPDMEPHYRGASIYFNTSRLEGLPNAFLQSWAHAVPTVSAGVDPDGVIVRKGLGGVAGSAADLAVLISSLMNSPEDRHQAGLRGHAHVTAQHATESVGGLAEEFLLEAIRLRTARVSVSA